MPDRHIHLHLRWKIIWEPILKISGIGLIAATFLVTEFLGKPYHVEYLLVGLAMCGIPITTQWISQTTHSDEEKKSP